MPLGDRKYLEIGSCDFATLNDHFAGRPSWSGTTVEAMPLYFDRLIKYEKNNYINAFASEQPGTDKVVFYYADPETVYKYGLPQWLFGCGSLYRDKNVLKLFSDDVVHTTYIPKENVVDIAKKIGVIDYLKIDTEGHDAKLLNTLLDSDVKIINITYEHVSLSPEEELPLLEKLYKKGYHQKRRADGNAYFALPSIGIFADAIWSMGSIVKDLQHTIKEWDIRVLDYRERYIESDFIQVLNEFDAVTWMCLACLNVFPELKNAAGMCNLPSELDHFTLLTQERMPKIMAGVSSEICAKMSLKYPDCEIYYTPASARASRFTPKKVATDVKKIGWVGSSTHKKHGAFGDNKRESMFLEICEMAGKEAVFSESNYVYENMQDFYNGVDVLLCTSSTEGGPLGPFEAIACGVPVISTKVGLVAEMKTVPFFETKEEAWELIKWYDQEGWQSLWEAQYKEFVESFSYEATAHLWRRYFSAATKYGNNQIHKS